MAALAGVLVVGLPGAGADTFGVSVTTDGGAGSLRAAIDEANANPGPDTIQLPAGTYTLSIPGQDEDANATGDLDIDGDLTIVGAGSTSTTIDAAAIDRVLDVQSGSIVVQGVTVAGGDSGPGTTMGGGIRQRDGNLTVVDSVVRDNRSWGGGGISSGAGALLVERSEIVDNVVESEPGNGSNGGGISKSNSEGSLVVRQSTIAGNASVGGNSGGLYANPESISISNSTFTGNTQYARTIGLENWSGTARSASFASVTIAGNVSTGPGGGIESNVGPGSTLNLTLQGVILQGNTSQGGPENCAVQNDGTFESLGSNLADDATCNLTEPTDLPSDSGTTLGALADNGGPTRTMALAAGSSAVDAATCSAAAPTDQRGAPRPVGPACDIGAYELGGEVPPSTTTTTTTEAPTTTTTEAPTTTTSTSEAPATSTTVPATSTTVRPGTTLPSAVAAESLAATTFASTTTGTLPVTGPADTLRLLLVAVGLVAGGFAVLLGSRRFLGERLVDDLGAGRDRRTG